MSVFTRPPLAASVPDGSLDLAKFADIADDRVLARIGQGAAGPPIASAAAALALLLNLGSMAEADAGDYSTTAATAIAISAAIDAAIDGAPGALDTLNELAAALGDDENFAGNVTNALAAKLAIAQNLADLDDLPTALVNLGLDQVDNTADADKPVSAAAQTALDAKAPLASPALTGDPTAPTQSPGNNTTRLATTAFVQAAVSALIAAAPGALDTLDELAAALGDDANFATTITNALALKAALASPTFTGVPVAPTAALATNTTQLATTEFVHTVAARNQIRVANQSFTSTSYADDNALSLTVANGETWLILLDLHAFAASANTLDVAFNGPAASTINCRSWSAISAGGATPASITAYDTSIAAITNETARITATIRMVFTAAGTFVVRAKRTSGSGAARLDTGSLLRAIRLG